MQVFCQLLGALEVVDVDVGLEGGAAGVVLGPGTHHDRDELIPEKVRTQVNIWKHRQVVGSGQISPKGYGAMDRALALWVSSLGLNPVLSNLFSLPSYESVVVGI